MHYKCSNKDWNMDYKRIYETNISRRFIVNDSILITLTESTRYTFIGFGLVFLVISAVANCATIIVNSRRKMRTFFRIMLFSLAASDLLTTIFSTTGYISQLSTKFIQIWHLGDIMCGCIPFMSTAAILINSMTLVGIAFDRYMAVMKVISGINWEPGILCCFAFVILVWGMAAGLASPMLMSYYTKEILLIITNPNNPNECIEAKRAEMCYSDKALNSFYFIIIFSVVFIPMVLTFIWLNGVIAIEIWNRRKFNKSLQYNITTNTTATAITKATAIKQQQIPTTSKIQTLKPVIVKSFKAISIMENIIENNNNSKMNDSYIENSKEKSNSIEDLETPSTLKTILEKYTNSINSDEPLQSQNYNYDKNTNLTVSVNIINVQSSITSSRSSTQQEPTQSEIVSAIGVKMQCIQNQRQQHQLQEQEQQQQQSYQTLTTLQNQENIKCLQNYPSHKRRETHQLRLFIVIILLITIFLICRLPTWIFLLMRLHGLYNRSIDWILHYSFGILSLFNCVLNPFCYTFMSETTRFICAVVKLFKRYIKNVIDIILKPFVLLYYWIALKFYKNEENNENISKENSNENSTNTSTAAAVMELVKLSNNNSNKSTNKTFIKRKYSKNYNCDQDASYAGKEIYTIFHEE